MLIRFRKLRIEVSQDIYGNWHAAVVGKAPKHYGDGTTFSAAIGDLVVQFPGLFGVEIRSRRRTS